MDLSHLSEEELIAATNEYIKRVYQSTRVRFPGKWISLSLGCHGFSEETEIVHGGNLHVERREHKYAGNNLFIGMRRLCDREEQDKYDKPIMVTLALEHKPEGEEAVFQPLDDDGVHF